MQATQNDTAPATVSPEISERPRRKSPVERSPGRLRQRASTDATIMLAPPGGVSMVAACAALWSRAPAQCADDRNWPGMVFASSNWVIAGHRLAQGMLTTDMEPYPINPNGHLHAG
jgi:hypothetical protein